MNIKQQFDPEDFSDDISFFDSPIDEDSPGITLSVEQIEYLAAWTRENSDPKADVEFIRNLQKQLRESIDIIEDE